MAREAGRRLLTGPVFLHVPDCPDRRSHEGRLEWARRDLAALTTNAPGTRHVVFAHCVYALSPGRLSEIAAPAREFGALLRLHAAESTAEAATAEARHGRRPVSCSVRCGWRPVHKADGDPSAVGAERRCGWRGPRVLARWGSETGWGPWRAASGRI
ncbi:hypothetical protein [Streptomyces sp. NPDC003710]